MKVEKQHDPQALDLINCTPEILEIILEGDYAIRQKLNLKVPASWTGFDEQAFPYILDHVKKQPGLTVWWAWLPIQTDTNTLIGTCSFKGPPDEKGVVEIGYLISPEFRNLGYATQIVHLLLEKAFADRRVQIVQAHTEPTENASTSVLKRNGFQFEQAVVMAGKEQFWRWVIHRA